MFTGKCSCSNGVKSVAFQNVSKFNQRVVEGSVSKGNYRHSQCTVTGDGIKVFKHQIGKPARVSRHSEDYQIARGNLREALTCCRQSEVIFIYRYSKSGCSLLGQQSDNLFCSSGGTKINFPHFFDFHQCIPFFVSFVNL